MATKETADLGPAHPPKEESIKVFKDIEQELKKELIKLRHKHDKHEPEYFQAVSDLSDQDLAGFTSDDFKEVRVAQTAYGVIIFGKLRIPAAPESGPSYIHFRAFDGGPNSEHKFHSFYTEEKEDESGGKTYRAIFTQKDELDWFDS